VKENEWRSVSHFDSATSGVLVAGRKLGKTKAKLARRSGKPAYTPPAPPKLKLKTQLRDPFCAHNFLAERFVCVKKDPSPAGVFFMRLGLAQ
jgi:hypothetical protein